MTNDSIDKSRRNWIIGASVVGAVGTGFVAVPFLGSWMPSERAKAVGGPVEIDISKLQSGEQLRAAWRGKAIYVVSMTEAMQSSLSKLEQENVLLDPESKNSEIPEKLKGSGKRAVESAIMVLVGVCTHLGCAPLLQDEAQGKTHSPNWLGGFFCPCHGSKFDYSGRVYKGVPAPTNLKVPPYYFKSDNLILIGQEEASA